MGQALYRKHRPTKLSEVIGQEHITDTLASAIKSGHISHAYLFTGPKGVGKTSVARILAHEVNGLAYKNNETYLDIIEIDAASNRRIDEIRELREKVYNAPTSAKYKVYIIDEVHMLTREAFNALLKTLEEPPEHAIFILATTEAHKLPDTIVSRTQRFSFKPIEDAVAMKQLRDIADEESIEVSDEALELIAQHGNGSFRDSISLLDQARNSSAKLGVDEILNILGIAPKQAIQQLLEACQSANIPKVIELLQRLHEQGSSSAQIAKQLLEILRQQYIDTRAEGLGPVASTTLMRELIEVPASHEPFAALQIALIEAALLNNPSSGNPVSTGSSVDLPETAKDEAAAAINSADIVPSEPDEPQAHLESLESTELWPKVLSEIKKHHSTLYSLARMAKTTTSEGKLELEFDFGFHQKRLSEPKNKQIIVDIIKKITGKTYQLDCVVAVVDAGEKPRGQRSTAKSESIATISNIFGDAEVLES